MKNVVNVRRELNAKVILEKEDIESEQQAYLEAKETILKCCECLNLTSIEARILEVVISCPNVESLKEKQYSLLWNETVDKIYAFVKEIKPTTNVNVKDTFEYIVRKVNNGES